MNRLRIRIIFFLRTLYLEIVGTHQVLRLRIAYRPAQRLGARVTALRILALFHREIIDTVIGRDIDGVCRTLHRSRYIRVGLHRKGRLEVALDSVGGRYDDRTGAIAYRHRLRVERRRIGLRGLIYHVWNRRLAFAYRIAFFVHEIQIGRLQLRCYQIIRAVQPIRETIPYIHFLYFRFIIRIIFVDQSVYAGIESRSRQVLGHVPVKFEEDDALITAVHRFLRREFYFLIVRTRIYLLRAAVRCLGHFHGSLAHSDLRRAVLIGVRGVLRVRTADIHKMGYA